MALSTPGAGVRSGRAAVSFPGRVTVTTGSASVGAGERTFPVSEQPPSSSTAASAIPAAVILFRIEKSLPARV